MATVEEVTKATLARVNLNTNREPGSEKCERLDHGFLSSSSSMRRLQSSCLYERLGL